jgi:hypothetical protein
MDHTHAMTSDGAETPRCGEPGGRVVLLAEDVTCRTCRAQLTAEGTLKRRHYAKSSMGDALCGAEYPDGMITAWEDDTTCPRCLYLLTEAAALAIGAGRRQSSRHGTDWRTPRDLDPPGGSVFGLPYEGDESIGEDF